MRPASAVAVIIAADHAQELRPALIISPGNSAPANGKRATRINGNGKTLLAENALNNGE